MLSDLRAMTARLPNGLALPCMEHGAPSGAPVLLLHGYTDSWRSFEPVLPHLPRPLRAIAPTLRGHGGASRPDTGYTMRDFSEDVVALMDTLRLPRAVVVGHSMGSLIAQRLAADHPGRVAGLMLVGAFADMRGNREVEALWADTVATLEDPIPDDLVWAFQSGTCAQPVPVGLIETAVRESLRVPARVWREALRGQIEADLGEARRRIAAPTLLLWGAQDSFAPRTDQDRLRAEIRGAELTVWREAGHAPHWEEPERFAHEMAAFVAGLAARHAA